MPTPASTGSRGAQNPPQVMATGGLAAIVQITKSTLYELAQEGKMPGQKGGNHWRFHNDVIHDWLKTTPKTEQR